MQIFPTAHQVQLCQPQFQGILLYNEAEVKKARGQSFLKDLKAFGQRVEKELAGPTIVKYHPPAADEAEHFYVNASSGRISGRLVYEFGPEYQRDSVVFSNPGNQAKDVSIKSFSTNEMGTRNRYMSNTTPEIEAQLSQYPQCSVPEPNHSLQAGTTYLFPVYRFLTIPIVEKLTRASFFNKVIQNCKTIEAGDGRMNFSMSQLF